jgi:hypothetical protein
MNQQAATDTPKKVRRCRVPDYGPWPQVGYVPPRKVMAALGGVSDETIRNYEVEGLLPKRQPITGNVGGWPVDAIRRAIEELPAKLAARAEIRRAAKAETLKKARAARASTQRGNVTISTLLLLTVAAGAALAMLGLVDAHALAMAGPLLGMGAVARATDPDQGAGESPEYVGHSLDGERIAKRDQHAARDGHAPPDRLLHSLLDLLAADGIRLAPTARLRAWCRTHQKALEQRA